MIEEAINRDLEKKGRKQEEGLSEPCGEKGI
jgi:hypothetical protein